MEPFVRHILQEETERQEHYRLYRDYYDGRHGVILTERQRQYLHVPQGKDFSANYMPIVVDSLASRLSIEAVEAPGLTAVLSRWARQMRLSSLAGGIHTAAIRDGDSYGLVEWDAARQRPRLFPHMAYDGLDGIHAVYTPERIEPLLFIKRWVEGYGESAGRARLNLYYPDRLERYWASSVAGATDWREMGATPLPVGPPIVHFTNRARGYRYGLSELEPGIPMQDALNKAIVDLLAAADASGFRIMVMIGGDPTKLALAPGSWVYLADASPSEASVAAIPGEALRPHIEVVDSMVQRVAQVTDTPLSYFQQSGQMASEGTHRQHEARMLAKARTVAVELGEQWEELMRVCLRLSNRHAGTRYDEDAEIEIVWGDFDIRDREEKLLARARAAAELIGAGYEPEQAAREAGFSRVSARRLTQVDVLTRQVVEEPEEPEDEEDAIERP
jgi:hypothetical protein